MNKKTIKRFLHIDRKVIVYKTLFVLMAIFLLFSIVGANKQEGFVAQDSTSIEILYIDSTFSNIDISLMWSGNSELDLVLQQPDGKIIDSEVAKIDSEIEYFSDESYEIYKIKNPVPGEWKARIIGKRIPAGEEEYIISAQGDSYLTINVHLDRDKYYKGDIAKIMASLSDDKSGIAYANVTATIEKPIEYPEEVKESRIELTKLISKDFLTEEEKERVKELRGLLSKYTPNRSIIKLYDDGAHGDSEENDGVYANYYIFDLPGTYKIDIVADGKRKSEKFTRSYSKSIYVYDEEKEKFLSYSPESLNIALPTGTKVLRQFKIISKEDVITTFKIVPPSKLITIYPSVVSLDKGQEKYLYFGIYVPKNQKLEYNGNLIIESALETAKIPIIINVNNSLSLEDLRKENYTIIPKNFCDYICNIYQKEKIEDCIEICMQDIDLDEVKRICKTTDHIDMLSLCKSLDYEITGCDEICDQKCKSINYSYGIFKASCDLDESEIGEISCFEDEAKYGVCCCGYQETIILKGEEVQNIVTEKYGEGIEIESMNLKNEGNRTIYEITSIKKGNLFFIFPISYSIKIKVDATTGEILETEEPWWKMFMF